MDDSINCKETKFNTRQKPTPQKSHKTNPVPELGKLLSTPIEQNLNKLEEGLYN